jgi:hypothetical protein
MTARAGSLFKSGVSAIIGGIFAARPGLAASATNPLITTEPKGLAAK